MVEYFGQQLEEFLFTQNGWVQSYGTRGVKRPVIYCDIGCKESMTVKCIKYAQEQTSKIMKGMLTQLKQLENIWKSKINVLINSCTR